MRLLDEESSPTKDRHFLWKAFLVAESTESDFLPNPSKCLNILSFDILINIGSSHAASASTESELEHICKRIHTLITPGAIFSTIQWLPMLCSATSKQIMLYLISVLENGKYS